MAVVCAGGREEWEKVGGKVYTFEEEGGRREGL